MSTNTGAVTASNGSFLVKAADGTVEELDLGTVMMSVNLKYVELLDVQIANQVSDTMERNDQLELVTGLLSGLRELDQDSDGSTDVSGTQKITIDGETKTLETWLKELGIEYSIAEGATNLTESLETLMEDIQSEIDTLNDDSEIASLQLQNLTEKRSNALQQASNLMSSAHNSSQTILGNY